MVVWGLVVVVVVGIVVVEGVEVMGIHVSLSEADAQAEEFGVSAADGPETDMSPAPEGGEFGWTQELPRCFNCFNLNNLGGL